MTDLLTPSALLEIEERARKATAGEWHVDGFHTSAVIHEEKPRIFNRICETDSEHFPNANWRHDAAFIAHARTDIPALLQHISALQEQIERAREHMRERCAKVADEHKTVWHAKYVKALDDAVNGPPDPMRAAADPWLAEGEFAAGIKIAAAIRALLTTPQA